MSTARLPLSLIDDLPPEIRVKSIYPHLSLKNLGLFGQTCKQAALETVLPKLLLSAVNAEPESYKQEDKTKLAFIAILKEHPELLFKSGTVINHFGRTMKGSIYRLLLGAGFDVWALEPVFKEIIPQIKNGTALAKVQFGKQFPDFIKQFPNGEWSPDMGEEVLYDNRNRQQMADVIAQLEVVAEKITADPCTHFQATLPETTAAVEALHQIFAPKEGEVITTGLHFPLGIMREIYKVFDVKASFLPAWNIDQLTFFSITVIGAAEAALSVVDGQCGKNGWEGVDDFYKLKGPDRTDGLFCNSQQGVPKDLAPIRDKLGRTAFVDFFGGMSYFLSPSPGVLVLHSKNGLYTFDSGCMRWCNSATWVGDLWKAKAEIFGNYYTATCREVSTPSRGP